MGDHVRHAGRLYHAVRDDMTALLNRIGTSAERVWEAVDRDTTARAEKNAQIDIFDIQPGISLEIARCFAVTYSGSNAATATRRVMQAGGAH